MFKIAKTFAFSASHQLTHLAEPHPCARLHGHNYVVCCVLIAPATDPRTGFVVDYRDLDAVKTYLDTTLDHRHLNDVFGDPRLTTAEQLARSIFLQFAAAFPALQAVGVSETPKTWAWYKP